MTAWNPNCPSRIQHVHVERQSKILHLTPASKLKPVDHPELTGNIVWGTQNNRTLAQPRPVESAASTPDLRSRADFSRVSTPTHSLVTVQGSNPDAMKAPQHPKLQHYRPAERVQSEITVSPPGINSCVRTYQNSDNICIGSSIPCWENKFH